MRAKNEIGWGPYSELNLMGATIETVPSTMSPPMVDEESVTNQQVKLTWDTLTGIDAGGSNVAITTYDLQMSNDETTWSDLATGVTGTTYTHSGLTGGTILYYRIRANNKYGSAPNYSTSST